MNLTKLNAASNPKITDYGIKHMKLRYLDASFNNNITYQGIKNMNLTTLIAERNRNITYRQIKHHKINKVILSPSTYEYLLTYSAFTILMILLYTFVDNIEYRK